MAEGDGESKQNMISLSKGCPSGAGTRCILGPSRDAQLTTPGLPSGKEGRGRPARTQGRAGAHPSRQPFREALAARACSDASCLRGCGWGERGWQAASQEEVSKLAQVQPGSEGGGPASVTQGVTNQVS